MKHLKKILALVLCLVMLSSLAACGSKSAVGGQAGAANGESPIEKREAVDVKGPITIEFWHTSAGDLGIELDKQVKKFNETNGKGITVKATYMGIYYDVLTKLKASWGSNAVPDLVVCGAGGFEELAAGGALADMSAYVARDNFDMENIPKTLRYYTEYYDGQIIEFPYLVSTAIIFYNKAYYPNGVADTLEGWLEQAKAITAANPGIYGMSIPQDVGYIMRPFLKSLGAPGLTVEGGMKAAALDDGIMERYLTDWLSWIEGGYCAPLDVTNSSTNMANEFMQGKSAALINSCATMVSYVDTAKEAGIELGFAPAVGYGGKAGAIGGGGLCAMSSSTDEELAAVWEFIKFLYEDEQIIQTHKVSGYLPMTYSAAQHPDMVAFWEENPGNKVAFEQLDWATFNEWSPYLQKWRDYINAVVASVLVSKNMTPKEGVEQLKRNASVTFR